MSRQVYLYGIGGAEKQYVTIAYRFLVDDDITIRNIVSEAVLLKMRNSAVEKVFAIDNMRGLRRDYMDSIKKHSIESCAVFKDILEREGIRAI